jgi:type I restriction enzyme R subunit
VNAIVKDLGLLEQLFKSKMESKVPPYVALVSRRFDDKDVDGLIEHFRDKDRRKEFFREYKEIERLYEIISPDAFLRPFLADYETVSQIYAVVRNAYAKRAYVDRAFQKKTNELVREHVGVLVGEEAGAYVAIDRDAIEALKRRDDGKATKVINLVKSIQKTADDESGDPFLIAMAERARAVQESFEDRQTSTGEALEALVAELERDAQRRKDQAAKGLDGLAYFVLCKLQDEGVPNAEAVTGRVREAFGEFPNWRRSERDLRELRKKVTFAIFSEEEDLDKVTALVDRVFAVLERTGGEA